MKEIFKKIITKILELEARAILKKYQPKVIAVTGSVGKTSTKDAIYSVISDSFYVRKSEKSFNSDIGVPLTILGCQNAWNDPFKWLQNIWSGLSLVVFKNRYPEWLILEIGADRPGDIQKISSWLKPDVVVVTKFSKVPVHIEYFKDKDAVIAEKGFLVNALKHDGTLVLNSDDEDVFAFRNKFHNKIISYGLLGDAEIRASNPSVGYQGDLPVGMQFKIEYKGNVVPANILGSLGSANIYAALAAVSVGIALGLNMIQITENLKKHETPRGRMRIIKGLKDTIIIDDTYNSSPVAVNLALESLKEIKVPGRKIVVLGDMMELGKHSSESHKQIGQSVVDKCDILITVGMRSRATADTAMNNGFDEKNIFQFENSVEAGSALQEMLQPGDLLLIKGSQSTRMEKIVEEIMAEPEKAPELLVRQEEEWKKR